MAEGTAKRIMAPRQPDRIVSGVPFDEDARIEASVRPKRLDEYIGQKRVKENISIASGLFHVDRSDDARRIDYRAAAIAFRLRSPSGFLRAGRLADHL